MIIKSLSVVFFGVPSAFMLHLAFRWLLFKSRMDFKTFELFNQFNEMRKDTLFLVNSLCISIAARITYGLFW